MIAPMLYAWWFATQRRWRGMFIALLIALSIREDTALVVIMLGLILLFMYRPGKGEHRDRVMALATIGLGFGWYVIATKFVIPHFNQGKQPFYIQYFYSNYGKDVPAIIETMVRHPNRVVGDATQPDRLRFYRDLALPLGGLPLAAPLALLMAAPQMLASVIGLSPYARSIHYQYTAMMIAPLMIAAIEGAWLLWRFKVMHVILPIWMLGCAYMTNVAWSPSPIGDSYNVWARAVAAPRIDARGVEAGARRRVGRGDVHLAAAPLAPRADLRLAEPVGAVVLGQRRRVPVAGSVDHRIRRARPAHRWVRRRSRWWPSFIAPDGPYQVLFDTRRRAGRQTQDRADSAAYWRYRRRAMANRFLPNGGLGTSRCTVLLTGTTIRSKTPDDIAAERLPVRAPGTSASTAARRRPRGSAARRSRSRRRRSHRADCVLSYRR